MKYQYAICYPKLSHPLASEKSDVKIKYACLLSHYYHMVCEADCSAKVRLDRFLLDFLASTDFTPIEFEAAAKDIMKTRFTPFKLFSYRYIFLFDCIFLFAGDDKNKADLISAHMKTSVHKRYHKRIDYLVENMYQVSCEWSDFPQITSEMQEAWESYKEYIHSTERSVIFTATMSAGKSTLINALIGREITNTKKAACTATVMDFITSPFRHTLYNVIDEEQPQYNIPCTEIRQLSVGRDTPMCVIGYFESCLGKRKLAVIDTPGVNSSLNPEHKKVTREALQNKFYDTLVYVIPVENYGSENDYAHLQFIKQRVSYGKIIFVVNMMDTCDFEDDSVSEIIDDISTHLTDIGFEEPIVCPVSAKAGLLFKQALTGVDLSENDTKALMAYYNKYACPEYDLRTCYTAQVENPIQVSTYKYTHIISEHQLYEALMSTGLPQLEQCIMDTFKEESACKM